MLFLKILVTITMLLFLAYFYKKRHTKRFNIELFIVVVLIFFYLPILFIELENYNLNSNISVLIPAILSIFIAIGLVYNQKNFRKLFSSYQGSFRPVSNFGFWSILLIIILLSIALYKGVPPTIDQFYSLISFEITEFNVTSVREYRETLTKSHLFGEEYSGSKLLRMLTKQSIYLFTSYMLINYKLGKTNLFKLILSYLICIFILLGEGSRSPLIFLFIYNLSAIYAIHKISAKLFIVGGLASFGLLIITSIFAKFGSGVSISYVVDSIISRIFKGNSANDVLAIDYILNDKIDYSFGKEHYNNFIRALPGNYGDKPFAYKLYRLATERHGTTYLTGTYMTTIFIDFGLLSILFCLALPYILYYTLMKIRIISNNKLVIITFIPLTFVLFFNGIIGFLVNILITIPLLLLFNKLNKISNN